MSQPTRYRPLRETFNFQRQCNQALEEGVAPGLNDPGGWMQPAVDLLETDDTFFLEMAIPGFAPEDIHISITGELLSICGEVLDDTQVEEGLTYHLRERKLRSFQRTIHLPSQIAIERSEAVFQNGELKLRLPKITRLQTQTIEIQAG